MSRSIVKKENNLRQKYKFPFEIAIPTYGNPILLRDTTLNILKAYRVPYVNITIFLQTKSKETIYEQHLIPHTYGRLIITGTTTIAEFYNSIQRYYEVGTPIIYIKDSIKAIYELQTTKIIQPLRSLLTLCKTGFLECEKANASLWGIAPSLSEMSLSSINDLAYIPGTLWGSINPGKQITLTSSVQEDYERSMEYFSKDGAVVRLNSVCALSV
jgi:hypothetical protein